MAKDTIIAKDAITNVVEWIPLRTGDTVLLVSISKEAPIRRRKDERERDFLRESKVLFQKKGAEVVIASADSLQSMWDDKMYDVILLDGVLERQKRQPMAEEKVLPLLRRHLRSAGRLYVIEENRIGLQFLAGYPQFAQEGLSMPRADSEGQGYTRKELTTLLCNAGYCNVRMYYPFANEMGTSAIYTESWQMDETVTYESNATGKRITLWDEKVLFSALREEGVYYPLSNVFLAEAYGSLPATEEPKLLFAKYSDHRKDSFSLRTSIYSYPSGAKAVTKTWLSPEARTHVMRMQESYEKLQGYYKGYSLQIAPCAKMQDGVGFTFLEGRKLAEAINEKISAGEEEDAIGLVRRLVDVVTSPEKLAVLDHRQQAVRFGDSTEFREMFGPLSDKEEELLTGEEYLSLTDVGLDFDSVVMSDDGWTVYDYEWVTETAVPFSYVLYRAIRKYFDGRRRGASDAKLLSLLFERFGITKRKALIYERMMQMFDRFMGAVREETSKEENAVTLEELLSIAKERAKADNIIARLTMSDGTTENRLVDLRRMADNEKEFYVTEIPLSGTEESLRMIPGQRGVLFVETMQNDRGDSVIRRLRTNADETIGAEMYFLSEDAWMEVPLKGERSIFIQYRFAELSKEAAEAVAKLLMNKKSRRGLFG